MLNSVLLSVERAQPLCKVRSYRNVYMLLFFLCECMSRRTFECSIRQAIYHGGTRTRKVEAVVVVIRIVVFSVAFAQLVPMPLGQVGLLTSWSNNFVIETGQRHSKCSHFTFQVCLWGRHTLRNWLQLLLRSPVCAICRM